MSMGAARELLERAKTAEELQTPVLGPRMVGEQKLAWPKQR